MIEEIDSSEEKNKLYKSKHIGLATYIGGPLAAGYLMYENFKSLNKPDLAKKAIILGIVFTIFLFVILISIPESIINKIPTFLIPIIYTAIVYYLIHTYQGDALEKHEQSKKPFFSIWRSIGIGLIAAVILGAVIVSYIFLMPTSEAYGKYDKEMKVFYKNEEQALKFYDNINSKSEDFLLEEVNQIMIPNWKRNIKITESISATEDLPSELVKQNNALLQYSKLRLKLSLVIKESITEGTDKRLEIQEINHKIDSLLTSLKK